MRLALPAGVVGTTVLRIWPTYHNSTMIYTANSQPRAGTCLQAPMVPLLLLWV
jgi:hypothetical protein